MLTSTSTGPNWLFNAGYVRVYIRKVGEVPDKAHALAAETRQCCLGFRDCLGINISDCDVCAFAGQRDGDGAAQASATAEYQSRLVSESKFHRLIPSSQS